MNDSGKEDEDGIYEDLPDFQLDETIAKLEESNCDLQNRLAELENVILDLNEEIKALHLEKSALKSENATLSTNISSLYKTAVAEVNRKDNLINELRKENFAFIKNKKLEAAPKNDQNSSPTAKNQDYGSRTFSNRHESYQNNSSGNRSRTAHNNDDRDRVRVRRRSYSNERRKSRSRSPSRQLLHRSKDLKNSKLDNRSPVGNHSSKSSRSDANFIPSNGKPSMGQVGHSVLSEGKISAAVPSKEPKDKSPTVGVKSEVKNESPLELKKRDDAASERAVSKTPVRNYDTSFNKNLVVVDKSVPNTIYTKRLRKRILDQMAQENEALKDPLTSENQTTPAVVGPITSETINNSNKPALTVTNSTSEIRDVLSNVPSKDISSSENVKAQPSSASNDKQIVTVPINIPEPQHENKNSVIDFLLATLSVKNSAGTIKEGNNHVTTACDLNIIPNDASQNGGTLLASKDEGIKCVLNNLTTSNIVVDCSLNLNADEKKKGDSILTLNNLSNAHVGSSAKPAVSPTNSGVPSLQNGSSNSGSLTSTSCLSYGHCFKKFKKDGKTRINPIYIGPRILTQKTKSEKRNTNAVRPVLSQYSNLSSLKNPKASPVNTETPTAAENIEKETEKPSSVRPVLSQYSNFSSLKNPKASSVNTEAPTTAENIEKTTEKPSSVRPVSSQYSNLSGLKNPKASPVNPETPTIAESIENKTEKPSSVETRIFSLFGKTPEKCQPFVSSGSLGTSSDNSLTNFSFLSSDSSPNFEKKGVPKTVSELVISPSNKLDTKVSPPKQVEVKICPAENEPVKSLQSREEQLASLFGDVSSDSSSDSSNDDAASKTKDPPMEIGGNKCLESAVLPSPASNKTPLPLELKAEVNYPPKIASMPDLSHHNLSNNNSNNPKSIQKISPNISNLSVGKRYVDCSPMPILHTPFKSTNNSSSLITFTPAGEMLSPIPPTPQRILDSGHAVTQNSRNLVAEKIKAPHGKANESNCASQPSVIEKASLPMQPKAEIIRSYLSKNSATPDGSLNSAEKTMNTPNSSSEMRSFDLLKTPVMHTPFKNTNDSCSMAMRTPAQEILSPIPPTPQGLLGKGGSVVRDKSGFAVSEKSESSDHFKIIKAPNSSALPVIIRKEPNSVRIEECVPSSETGSGKKDTKSLSYDDGSSNLSVNSALVDKKIFLSPSSISVPSVCCTPFKTFSSDSLQSFMHTPARELLSPIPKTPLGSWEIDNDRTNSCDVSLENNPNKNSLSQKEIMCVKDGVMHKVDDNQDGQLSSVSSAPVRKEERKPALSMDKYFITQNEKTDIDTHSAFKPENVLNKENPLSVSGSKDLTLHPHILADSKRKTEAESVASSALPTDSCDKSELAMDTGEHEQNLVNNKVLDLSSTDLKPGFVTTDQNSASDTPVRSNISENNISISSVSEQMQFRRTSRKVRKVVLPSTTSKSAASNVHNVCDDSTISSEKTPSSAPADSSKNDLSRSIQQTLKSHVNSKSAQNGTSIATSGRSASSVNPKKGQDLERDLIMSCNKIVSNNSPTKARRAVLIPTDVANNIVKNMQKNIKASHKNKLAESAARASKRSRSSDKCDSSPKKFKDASKKGPVGSREKMSSNVATKINSLNPEQNLRKESYRKSRSSHRKSVERSSKSTSRNRYSLPTHRLYDRRSRSVSRCRISHSRRSVSKNLGSDYLSRAHSNARNKRPEKEIRPVRKSSSLESSPPSTSSSHSESKKENRAVSLLSKNSPKPKKTTTEPTSKQSKISSKGANEVHHERGASVNSSLSSVSTFSDLPSKNEPLSFMKWKMSQIDLNIPNHRYESIFLSVANKKYFHPADPRIQSYLRRSDSSSLDENEPHGPRAASTPKLIKRKSKNIKLGDSTQVVSPIRTTDSSLNAKTQTEESSKTS